MEILKYGGIAVLAIGALAILIFAAKTKKLFKTLLFNAFLGLAVMIIIDLTAKFTGAHIPVNWWTVTGSAVFGIPAVCGYLILPIIFL
ncbi:MAG: pro-sigmaK processing inhibitor BofA family protein [Acutalibacteraceae bacterium]|nr:pro-sigmaK processing inhibitor BofA family protein [Acutalibacteraceae bacterium]